MIQPSTDLISTPHIVRDRENEWIYAQWSGIQTLDIVQTAGLHYLEMMREEPCPRLLNDHHDVIGRFLDVNEWIVNYWAPQAVQAGLRTVAQVLAPGVETSPAVRDLIQRLAPRFTTAFFTTLPEAQAWLRAQP
ncbi:hypothetical protein SAMN02745146_3690 [Hymenobacter daecheongensis DSM 21074]|uniref:SpoIIAA-like n=1 Tax=Hymenobacter daecheongensis DSM 21074 TaxID=1121955 RepID=A0A1M6LAT5_9BACT|nr:hypothetical protein [Hymenobacter daecheongensis]SHJ68283.1 hypothetical protein SAMN02745146_3690 [Hymenobacter daecheongensis DSM 21074]